MTFQVIVTLGPACLNESVLRAIDSAGSCIYRINGAHFDAEQTREMYQEMTAILGLRPVMIDLPGNKIRTSLLEQPIKLTKGETFELHSHQVNYPEFASLVKRGDLIKANDSIYTMEVESVFGNTVLIRSHSDGYLGSNKGIHVKGIHADLPFLLARDYELIEAACCLEVKYLALSFVRGAEDVREVKELLAQKGNTTIRLISKIETQSAVEQLGYILGEVEAINIDRGDLSADVGMLRVPLLQERIIESAVRAKKDIFLATQFLTNMEKNPVPLIPEVVALYKVIQSGVSGIQLSGETALGVYPAETVKMVFDIYSASFAG